MASYEKVYSWSFLAYEVNEVYGSLYASRFRTEHEKNQFRFVSATDRPARDVSTGETRKISYLVLSLLSLVEGQSCRCACAAEIIIYRFKRIALK